jgi:hypothetical protein
MKLHFRYHTYLYTKKGGTVYDDGCKYCNDRLVNVNGESTADKNENDGERGKATRKSLYDL